MVAKDVGILELKAESLEVFTRGIKSTEGWSTVVKLPASRLSARKYYVFCYGFCGNFFKFVAPTTGFTEVEIGLRHSGSSYIVSYHRMDPHYNIYTEQRNNLNEPIDSDRGMPFMFGFPVDFSAGAGDLEIIARIKVNSLNNSPGASFVVDRPAILAIDRDTITEESTMVEFTAASGAPATMPRSNQAPLTRHTLNGGASDGGQYLIIHGANITNEDPANPARVWVDDGGTSLIWSSPIGCAALGKKGSARHWVSQAGIFTLPNSFSLRQRMQHTSSNANYTTTINDSYIWAMKLHADQKAFVHDPPAQTNDFWAPRYSGAYIDTTQVLAHPPLLIGLSAAMTVSYAHKGYLELNGGSITSQEDRPFARAGGLYVHTVPGQLTNLHALWTSGTLYLPNGNYLIRAAGARNPWDTPGSLNAKFLQIFGMGLRIGAVPTLDADEIVGPDLVIVPDREGTVAVGSLLTLPIQPSWSVPIDEGSERRELRIPRGDHIVSPRFLAGQRIFDLGWTGLNITEGESLSTFFDDLLITDGGTFAWTPIGDTTAKAFTLADEAHAPTRDADGSMTLRVRILELVFVAP